MCYNSQKLMFINCLHKSITFTITLQILSNIKVSELFCFSVSKNRVWGVCLSEYILNYVNVNNLLDKFLYQCYSSFEMVFKFMLIFIYLHVFICVLFQDDEKSSWNSCFWLQCCNWHGTLENKSTSLWHHCSVAIQDFSQEQYSKYIFQGDGKALP